LRYLLRVDDMASQRLSPLGAGVKSLNEDCQSSLEMSPSLTH
jgi:hypothetical protein